MGLVYQDRAQSLAATAAKVASEAKLAEQLSEQQLPLAEESREQQLPSFSDIQSEEVQAALLQAREEACGGILHAWCWAVAGAGARQRRGRLITPQLRTPAGCHPLRLLSTPSADVLLLLLAAAGTAAAAWGQQRCEQRACDS